MLRDIIYPECLQDLESKVQEKQARLAGLQQELGSMKLEQSQVDLWAMFDAARLFIFSLSMRCSMFRR